MRIDSSYNLLASVRADSGSRCFSWITTIQNKAETFVEKCTTSLHSSRGVESVMSCQAALSVAPETNNSSSHFYSKRFWLITLFISM